MSLKSRSTIDTGNAKPVRKRCPKYKTWSTPVLRPEQEWFCIVCLGDRLRMEAGREAAAEDKN
jgi:hypothetical protein